MPTHLTQLHPIQPNPSLPCLRAPRLEDEGRKGRREGEGRGGERGVISPRSTSTSWRATQTKAPYRSFLNLFMGVLLLTVREYANYTLSYWKSYFTCTVVSSPPPIILLSLPCFKLQHTSPTSIISAEGISTVQDPSRVI